MNKKKQYILYFILIIIYLFAVGFFVYTKKIADKGVQINTTTQVKDENIGVIKTTSIKQQSKEVSDDNKNKLEKKDIIISTSFDTDNEGHVKTLMVNNNIINMKEYDIASDEFKFDNEMFDPSIKMITKFKEFKISKTLILDQNILDNKFPIDKLVFANVYNIIDDKSKIYPYPSFTTFSVIFVLNLDGSLLKSFVLKDKLVNSISLNQQGNLVLIHAFNTSHKESLTQSIIFYEIESNEFKKKFILEKAYDTVFFYRDFIFTIAKLEFPYNLYEILGLDFEVKKSIKIDHNKEMIWFDSIGIYKKNRNKKTYIYK